MSVSGGECDARPTVTFPATRHNRQLTGTKLYCFVTEAHICKQLAQGCTGRGGTAELLTRDLLIASPAP